MSRQNSENPSIRKKESVVYGVNPVAEALRSQTVDYLLVSEGCKNRRVQEIIDRSRAAGISVRFQPRKAVERLAGTRQHQDVVAVRAARRYATLESLIEGKAAPLLIVLDSVEDPRNLGAVVRTAAALGVDGLIIPDRRAAGLTAVAAKAAAGGLEHLPVARVTNLARALEWLKEQNVWVTGFEAAAETVFTQADFRGPCALVFGGEGRGLRRLVRESCDRVVSIPLSGPIPSLNVSVAVAVALYEVLRRRGATDSEPKPKSSG